LATVLASAWPALAGCENQANHHTEDDDQAHGQVKHLAPVSFLVFAFAHDSEPLTDLPGDYTTALHSGLAAPAARSMPDLSSPLPP